MTPRELQTAILDDSDTEPHRVTNDMGKVADYREKDAAVAAILNSKAVGAGSRAVPCHLAKKLLIKRGKWRGIRLAAEDANHSAVVAADAAVSLAEDPRMDADFLDPAASALLDALVASGLISAEDRTALEALSRTASTISAADVSRAMRGPWGDEQE